MAFAYSKEGSSKYLQYHLGSEEVVNQDALAMLTNNDIAHVLSPRFSQLDAVRTLTYDVTGLHPASEFFFGHVFNKRQWLDVLIGAADGLLEAQDYMLDENAFAASLDYLFIDEYLHAKMIYVPIEGFRGGSGAQAFLGEIAARMSADRTMGDIDYLAIVRNALARDDFDLDKFKKQLVAMTLERSKSSGASQAFLDGFDRSNVVGAYGANEAQPPVSPVAAVAPGADQSHSQTFVNGMAIPPAAGGVPPADGQPSDGERKSLFGGLLQKRAKAEKKEKPSKKEKSSKKEKPPKKEKRKREKKSLFGKKNSASEDPSPSQAFSVPGADGVPPVSSPVQNPPAPAPLAASELREGVTPAAVDYSPSGFVSPMPNAASAPQGSPMLSGEGYIDQDFGLTMVHGIPRVSDKAEPAGNMDGASVVASIPAAYFVQTSTGIPHPVSTNPFRIGRRKNAVQLYIPDDKLLVSRVHAMVSCESGSFFIEDNKSKNGTFVNGKAFGSNDKVALVDGDLVRIGEEEFVFHLGKPRG